MAKRQRRINAAVIDKRLREGRGQGKGAAYSPWLHIQDVPSQGLTHRIKGWKTEREHHFLSTLECDFFYVLDWSPVVRDIREQYPLLPLAETEAIAGACGFRHPADPRTQEPIVMTTDFVITLVREAQEVECARAVKPSAQLQSARVLEKLEIERRYWQARRIDWGIVTEREIPRPFVKNVQLLHNYRHLDDRLPLTTQELHRLARVLTQKVVEGRLSLRQAAAACDQQLGFEPGTGLTVAYHLLAQRQWRVDLHAAIEPGKKLVLLNGRGLALDHGGSR